jgi:hypothetical protein
MVTVESTANFLCTVCIACLQAIYVFSPIIRGSKNIKGNFVVTLATMEDYGRFTLYENFLICIWLVFVVF